MNGVFRLWINLYSFGHYTTVTDDYLNTYLSTDFQSMNSKKLLWAMVFIISSCFIATSSYSSEESSGQFQPISGQTIDIDGDGDFDALTDGLLLLRSMFGLSGAVSYTHLTLPTICSV